MSERDGGSGSSSEISKVSKPKRLDVWKHFEKFDEQNKAICKLCNKELAYRGGTINLREHLKSKQSLTYKPATTTQATILKHTTLSSCAKLHFCSKAQLQAITDKIANMITLDLRPIHIVESEGFKDLMATLEPGYKIASCKNFSQVLCRKYDVVIEKLLDNFAREVHKVSLTTDIWTSGATEAYNTVTGHYISRSWNLHLVVLETAAFPGCHTGQAIADRLKEVAASYGVTDEMLAVVHDQAANVECSQDILSSELGWESMHCIAHCLQLCLKSGLSITSIDRLLGAARKLVRHFKHSVVATEALKEQQVCMNVLQNKLAQDVTTRWNSSYYMLERLVQLR